MSVVKKIKQVTSGAAVGFTAAVLASTVSGTQLAISGAIVSLLFGGATGATAQVTSSDRVKKLGTATVRRIKQE